MVKKMERADINAVVISKVLHTNTNFINTLNAYNITTFDGKWLGEYFIADIIEYLEKRVRKRRTS